MPPELSDVGHWYRFVQFRGSFEEAPAALVPAPTASVLADSTLGTRRAVRMLVCSPRRAPEISVHVTTTGRIWRAGVEGISLEHASPAWERPGRVRFQSDSEPSRTLSLTYFAPPERGFWLEIETDSGAALTVAMVDRSYELPGQVASLAVLRDPRTAASRTTLATDVRSF
jgi:hypothetical protein